MTTLSAGGGSWTFYNYGPLTTTYTPAPSCSATDRIFLGTIDSDGLPYLTYNVQCETTWFSDCVPSATATPSVTSDGWRASVGNYYSPGLYCPSGWETVGQAARDGNKPYTTSGVMSFGASDRALYLSYDYIPTLLAKNLQPSETVALCCPSGYTAEIAGGCFTTVPSYTPTQVCDVYESSISAIGSSTSIYTTDGTKTEEIVTTLTTGMSLVTHSESWTPGDGFAEYYTPIRYITGVTLIHRENDVQATGSNTATATATRESTATGTAASTSNAAARSGPRASSWSGFGAVFGISLASAALGAAIIFPF
ncbi:uncharacterized protein N7498_009307 [Penicillium cinerascens]|uniref:Uncharacterized protein n=1 Tax=Penicillium cinerascens TaxID=70096 RepID=A0A9W9J5P4_9EURO|nr:uncharacterized protein N7498_009307 [Penicillium cinerascens]KAJ5190322.1 hypothetical protein N7498_009307 [Penicillium cinerascens]